MAEASIMLHRQSCSYDVGSIMRGVTNSVVSDHGCKTCLGHSHITLMYHTDSKWVLHFHLPEQKIDDETVNNSCQCGKNEENNNVFVLQQFSHISQDVLGTGNGRQLKQNEWDSVLFCTNFNFHHL